MKVRVPFKPEVILALLLAGITLNILSAFFFMRVDTIVNSDLYDHGLQYSDEWYAKYSTYSKLTLSFLGISIVLTGMSMALVLIHVRNRNTSARFVSYILIAVSVVTTALSAVSFSRLDYVVHNDLYQYGLQFSNTWATKYWTYADFMLAFEGFATAMIILSATLMTLSAHAQVEVDRTKLACLLMLLIGALALVASVGYSSSILAFIGLGLVFWGAVLMYVQNEEYTKKSLLDTAESSQLLTLDQTMQGLGYKGKTIYLPPKYFKDPETSKACVLKNEGDKLPPPEQIQKQEDKIYIENSQALLVTPPGAELARLFEKTLGTNFTKVDLNYVQQNMPKLFIEDLEIAEDIRIENKNGLVQVAIENTIFKNVHEQTLRLSNTAQSLGSPISSAIAIVLAKATGKPITINGNEISKDGKTITIEYALLDETEEEQST